MVRIKLVRRNTNQLAMGGVSIFIIDFGRENQAYYEGIMIAWHPWSRWMFNLPRGH